MVMRNRKMATPRLTATTADWLDHCPSPTPDSDGRGQRPEDESRDRGEHENPARIIGSARREARIANRGMSSD
jgi:hypothetical protein